MKNNSNYDFTVRLVNMKENNLTTTTSIASVFGRNAHEVHIILESADILRRVKGGWRITNEYAHFSYGKVCNGYLYWTVKGVMFIFAFLKAYYKAIDNIA